MTSDRQCVRSSHTRHAPSFLLFGPQRSKYNSRMRLDLWVLLLVCVRTSVVAQANEDTEKRQKNESARSAEDVLGHLRRSNKHLLEDPVLYRPEFGLSECRFGLDHIADAQAGIVDLTMRLCLDGLRWEFVCDPDAAQGLGCAPQQQRSDILLRAMTLPWPPSQKAELEKMAAIPPAPVRKMPIEDRWNALKKLVDCELLNALRDLVKDLPPASEEQLADYAEILKKDPTEQEPNEIPSRRHERRDPDAFSIPVKATYAFRKLHDSMLSYRPAGDPSSWEEYNVATVENNLLCLGNEGNAPERLAQFRKKWAPEKACRADGKCMDRRVATANTKLFKKKAEEVGEEICNLRATIAGTKYQIAEEHRYARRTGVLSLSDLQELKENLRDFEEILADRMSDYRMLLGKSAKVSCNPAAERTHIDDPSFPPPPPPSPPPSRAPNGLNHL